MHRNIINLLDAMLGAVAYQLEDEQLISLYTELIGRFKNYSISVEYSDYGNLIYGTLVMLFGDYGTSPRTGWFDPEDAMRCAEYVQNLKDRLNEV